MKKQRLVVNLVSPVAQAMEMAKSEIQRERKKEEGRKKTEIPPPKNLGDEDLEINYKDERLSSS